MTYQYLNKKEFGLIIGKNLKKLRGALTQQQFAEMIGVHYQQISRYENGLSVPNNKTLDKISNVLGVTIAELVNIETEGIEKNLLSLKKLGNVTDKQLTKEFIKIIKRDSPEMRHILQATIHAILETMDSKIETKKGEIEYAKTTHSR